MKITHAQLKQIIKEEIKNIYENNNIVDLPTTILVYASGPKLIGGNFSTSYIGTGEGNAILGPGIYFSDNKNVALLYAKRFDNPFLHEVELSTDGFYNPITGQPLYLRELLLKEEEKLANKKGLQHLPYGISLIHGSGRIGNIVREVGPKNALNIFSHIGLRGCYEKIAGGTALEFAVFDLQSIKLIKSSPVNLSNINNPSSA